MSAMVARGGIDLGGTKIQAVVSTAVGSVLGQSRRPTPTEGGPPTWRSRWATRSATLRWTPECVQAP